MDAYAHKYMNALFVIDLNQSRSLHFSPGSIKDLYKVRLTWYERFEINHTLMALAAPCDLSTLPDPDLATSDGSSASNFILISYKRQKSTEAMIVLGI